VLVPGETVYIPPGKAHKFTVLGEQPAKLLIIYCPPLESTDTPFER
jgi:mannose-6-phosphate isomerase-like protein (cupin superfamily)